MLRSGLNVRMYVALRTVLVSNTVLLLTVATLLFRFMEWPAGLVGAAATLVLAGVSIGATRWTDRLYDRPR